MRPAFQHSNEWRLITKGALVLLLGFVLVEMLMYSFLEEIHLLETIETLEILLSCILIVDLIILYLESRSKYQFLKRNWLKIIAVFPFGLIFRALRILQIEQLIPMFASTGWFSEAIMVERVAQFSKGIKLFGKSTELVRDILR